MLLSETRGLCGDTEMTGAEHEVVHSAVPEELCRRIRSVVLSEPQSLGRWGVLRDTAKETRSNVAFPRNFGYSSCALW